MGDGSSMRFRKLLGVSRAQTSGDAMPVPEKCDRPGLTNRPAGGSGGHHRPGAAHRSPRPTGAPTSPPAGPTLSGWPRNISWSDFQEVGARPAGVNEAAQIKSDVTQPNRVGVVPDNGMRRLAAYTVTVSIGRDQSWVVTDQKSAALLAHEQGHFDITGLSARDLVTDLSALRAATLEGLQSEVTRLIEQQGTLAEALGGTASSVGQYDKETNHGSNRDAQQRWEGILRGCIQNGTRLSASLFRTEDH